MQIGCGLIRQNDIALVGVLGFDYVEFMGKYLAFLNEREFQTLVQLLNKNNIGCWALNGYCPPNIIIAGPGFDPKAARRYARTVAERAKEMGTFLVGIGSPMSRNLPIGFEQSLARKQLKDFLKITAEELGRYDITVCLEALASCYCNFINSTVEAVEITREIGWESIKTIIDYYNMEQLGESNINVKPWMKEIAHVHMSDDAGSPFQRDFLKKEKTKVHQERIQRLEEAGYNGTVTIEVDVPVDIKRTADSLRTLRCL